MTQPRIEYINKLSAHAENAENGEIFQLGLHQEYDNYAQTVLASPATATRNTNVLVIEDEPAASLILQKSLQSVGCNVDTSFDGLSAVNMVVEKKYDLIILDWCLPTMTGKEFLRLADKKIRQNLSENISMGPIPVVICSSKEIDDIQLPIVSSFGYYYYWNKNLPFSTVINSLDGILRKLHTDENEAKKELCNDIKYLQLKTNKRPKLSC